MPQSAPGSRVIVVSMIQVQVQGERSSRTPLARARKPAIACQMPPVIFELGGSLEIHLLVLCNARQGYARVAPSKKSMKENMEHLFEYIDI
jgi:hypothetical protein